jgi:hypothetical protein
MGFIKRTAATIDTHKRREEERRVEVEMIVIMASAHNLIRFKSMKGICE